MQINDVNFNRIELVQSAGMGRQLLRDPRPQICFSGRSNSGKSSLINALLRRKALARVSASPGKTVTINYYLIDEKLYFTDLPGYGFAKRTEEERRRWSALAEEYFAQTSPALLVQLIDIKTGANADDRQMLRWMAERGQRYVIAATKADKLGSTQLKANVEALKADPLLHPSAEVICTSTIDSRGVDELRRCIIGSI